MMDVLKKLKDMELNKMEQAVVIKEKKSFSKFLIIWIGSLISSMGSGLTAFALGVYVYKTTQSATYVSMVTLCAFFPTILLSPIAGVMADRFDRRLMMILGDSFSALGLVYILMNITNGNIRIWQICIGVAVSAVFCSLTETSYKASITDLLTEEEYAKASGLVQVAGSSKYLISPVLAGFLLISNGIELILIIDILTFFLTVMTVVIVRKSIKSTKIVKEKLELLEELYEGWKCIVKPKGILVITILLTAVTFYMGFFQTLYIPMILPLTNAKDLGIIQSISAIGLLVSSLVIGICNIKKHFVKVLSLGLASAGLFFSLMGASTNLYFIGAFGFIFFGSLPFINTSADVLIRKNIPNELQGRAWGIIGLISQLGYIFAYSISGLLADYVFNPLLTSKGILANSIGSIIGTGEGRGIGLMFIISGILIIITAYILYSTKSLKELE